VLAMFVPLTCFVAGLVSMGIGSFLALLRSFGMGRRLSECSTPKMFLSYAVVMFSHRSKRSVCHFPMPEQQPLSLREGAW